MFGQAGGIVRTSVFSSVLFSNSVPFFPRWTWTRAIAKAQGVLVQRCCNISIAIRKYPATYDSTCQKGASKEGGQLLARAGQQYFY